MENKDVLDIIESEKKGDAKEVAEEENMIKFLIFRIADHKYALYAEDVREIVIDSPLFYVPFVPPYIRGFINRHGEPYTVFDLHVLFEQEKLDSSTYLILNNNQDQVSFIISDVVEITNMGENSIHPITSQDSTEIYFAESIAMDSEQIALVNIPSIMEKLKNDIES